MRDTEILREVLDRWKAGIDAGAPQRIAEVFTENAIFQGLHPYSVGRQGVVDYYSAQPPGMTVTYRLLETRRPADDLVLGYASVDFAFPDRPTVDVYLGVLLERGDDGWRIGHYQVSRLG
ncbi:nuclear transport factor 2 family protein [Mycolicibacterium stellerae]|uniref:nuclear transport factor 2 family protein n=1 Tax=Mycolicibacterium stellerae TaxID=2358193 RepID=UPI002E151F82